MIHSPTLSLDYCRDWRPDLKGLTDEDILAFYHALAPGLRADAVCVEIGTWRCRSLLFLAELVAALGKDQAEVWGIDPYRYPPVDGDMEACTVSYREALEGLVQFGNEQEIGHIRMVRAKSLGARFLFSARTVDMVMLDGDHRADAVASEIEAWTSAIRPGGILAGHDFAPAWPGVVEAVEAWFPGRYRVYGTVWCVEF